jgi:hypothetical protein
LSTRQKIDYLVVYAAIGWVHLCHLQF